MNLLELQTSLPNYAKDIRLNLSSLMNSEDTLTKQQHWGTLLACAMACKNEALYKAISTDAKSHLTTEAYSAAKSAAALMAMNNVYYRFTHLVSNNEYTTMPANLRMSIMAQPGIDKNDFELFSLAVSAIFGCGKCMDAHEKILQKNGITKEQIQQTLRIAAIAHATATILSTEKMEI